ncbi:MAG: 50S ribosomal protein L31e [Nitrososphaerota archaeon]
MSQLRKEVTLNLREAYKAPKLRRAKRALNIIREKAARIAKAERVKISEELARFIHSRSIERPPRRVTILVEKDEKGEAIVRLGGEGAAEQGTDQ